MTSSPNRLCSNYPDGMLTTGEILDYSSMQSPSTSSKDEQARTGALNLEEGRLIDFNTFLKTDEEMLVHSNDKYEHEAKQGYSRSGEDLRPRREWPPMEELDKYEIQSWLNRLNNHLKHAKDDLDTALVHLELLNQFLCSIRAPTSASEIDLLLKTHKLAVQAGQELFPTQHKYQIHVEALRFFISDLIVATPDGSSVRDRILPLFNYLMKEAISKEDGVRREMMEVGEGYMMRERKGDEKVALKRWLGAARQRFTNLEAEEKLLAAWGKELITCIPSSPEEQD